MTRILTLLAALTLAAPLAHAQSDDAKTAVTETVAVAAAPEAVWARIGQFQDMGWHPAVFATEGQGGEDPHATRALTLMTEDGPIIEEELTEVGDQVYAYRITAVDPAVLPVRDYASALMVMESAGGGALVVWSSTFEPADMPAAEAADAVSGVYRLGLDAVKEALEAE